MLWLAAALAHPVSELATELVAIFDEEQKGAALYDFEDDERYDLRLAPLGLEGLPLRDMSDAQAAGALGMLGTVLTDRGLETVEAVMALEPLVKANERATLLRIMAPLRDPERYWLSIFGLPGDPAWGFRFDGHHVSVNVTEVAGRVSATPLFLGAQPHIVLGEEETAARALVATFSEDQLSRASLPYAKKRGLMVATDAHLALDVPLGLPRADMNPDQQLALDELVALFSGRVRDLPSDTATAQFAWASEGDRCYFRVQGDSFIAEYDDTLPDGDHVHTLWRSAEGDYGKDLLQAHRREHHGY